MKQKCYHKIKDINIHIREIEFLGVLNETIRKIMYTIWSINI